MVTSIFSHIFQLYSFTNLVHENAIEHFVVSQPSNKMLEKHGLRSPVKLSCLILLEANGLNSRLARE